MPYIKDYDTWADLGLQGATLEPNRAPRGTAVHYPGAGRFAFALHSNCRAQVRAWDAMHRARGSRMIEYGAILCSHLVLMECRNRRADYLTRVGSNGTAQANSTHLSVQLMRGTNDTPPTDDELHALAEWIRYGRDRGLGPEVKGHRDFYATACPGDLLYSQLDDIARYASQPAREDPTMQPYADYVAVKRRIITRGQETVLGVLDTRNVPGYAVLHELQASFAFQSEEKRPPSMRVRFVRMPQQDGTGEYDHPIPRGGPVRFTQLHMFTGGEQVEVRVTIPGAGAPVQLRYAYLKAARLPQVKV